MNTQLAPLIPILLAVLAGCTESSPADGHDDQGEWHTLDIYTAYDNGLRTEERTAEDKALDVPNGTPAGPGVVQLNVRLHDPSTRWAGDAPCAYTENAYGDRFYSCDDRPEQEVYRIPPPAETYDSGWGREHTYWPLDDEGHTRISVPAGVDVRMRVNGDYSDPLLALAEDPDACDDEPRFGSPGRFHDYAFQGGLALDDGGTWYAWTGDAAVTVDWVGYCVEPHPHEP